MIIYSYLKYGKSGCVAIMCLALVGLLASSKAGKERRAFQYKLGDFRGLL